MKQKTVLVFPSIRQLWDFAQAIHVNFIEINAASRTLICDCNKVDIALAKEKYGATVREDSFASEN